MPHRDSQRDQPTAADFLAEKFRLPGYSTAMERVIFTGSATLALGQMTLGYTPPRSYVEGLRSEEGREQLLAGAEINTWEKKSQELIIADSDCIEGNYSIIFEQLSEQSVAIASDLEQMRLRTLVAHCKAAGQEARYEKGASPLDIFLAVLDQTLIQFDSHGHPRFEKCFMAREHSGRIDYLPYAFLIQHLEEAGTTEQKLRFRKIVQSQSDNREAGRRAF